MNKIIVELTTGPESGISYISEQKLFKVEGVLEGPVIYYVNSNDINNVRENNSKNYPCSNCSQMFIRRCDLVRHLRTHSGEKPFPCPECGEGFPRKDVMVRHLQTHTGVKPHICVCCKRHFSRKSDMEKHFQKHKGKAYRCTKCNVIFVQKTQLMKHMRTHFETTIKCQDCGKTFARRKGSVDVAKHPDGQFNVYCRSCFKKRNEQQSQEQESDVQEGAGSSQDKAFVCPECGDGFGRKSDMIRHLRLHSGVKPFSCSICSRSFSRKGDMVRHRFTHSKVKPHVCAVCDKGFSRKSDLESHAFSHQLEEVPIEQVEEFAVGI